MGIAAGECVACGYDRIGLCAFFDPVNDSAEHVEMIERRATAAVRHPGHEENTAPRGNNLSAVRQPRPRGGAWPQALYCAGALADVYASLGGEVFYAGKPYAPIYKRSP